jgi:hypothetical protein
MSVRRGFSDWSGMVTANSLPTEARERLALNARLLESVLHPGRNVTESVGRSTGLPIHLNTHSGQSAAVSVDTLRMPGGRPAAVGPSMGPGAGALDRWDQNRLVESWWRGTVTETITGRRPRFTESKWPGPMAGSGGGYQPSATGMYDYDPEDPFHRIGGGPPTGRNRFRYGPRPRSQPDWRGRVSNTIMPSVIGDDDSEEEEDSGVRIRSEDEEEERVLPQHPLTCSCRDYHPERLHGDWQQEQIEKERLRLRQRGLRTSENNLRTIIREHNDLRRRQWTMSQLEQAYRANLLHNGRLSECRKIHNGITHKLWQTGRWEDT